MAKRINDSDIVDLAIIEAREALTWSEYVLALDNALAWHLYR